MEIEHKFEHKPNPNPKLQNDSANHNGSNFECNICLEYANEPVVTLCGHLYCWVCIYKWLHIQTTSLPSDQEYPHCPVCKSEISHTAVIPLYGRGGHRQSKLDSQVTSVVAPPRPRACGTRAFLNATNNQILPPPMRPPMRNPSYDQVVDEGGHVANSSSPGFNRGRHVSGNSGMFGEMVYARVFGNSQSLYTYQNSYDVVGRSCPRIRRHQMQADKSLSRISLFLLCCFLLCLIVF